MNRLGVPVELWDSDLIVDQLIREYDDNVMPVPDIEFEPHLLISKVRKHYMDYIIKLLSVNYETNQRLLNKNIYLPSAIWRCAKNIEMSAAQTCMVVQLYRKNIVGVIKDLKNSTKKGKLYKKLYESLHSPPKNEKSLQTKLNKIDECNCQCTCSQRKRRRRITGSPKAFQNVDQTSEPSLINELNGCKEQYDMLITANLNTDCNQTAAQSQEVSDPMTILLTPTPAIPKTNNENDFPPKSSVRMSVESQDSDNLMLQLEKIFQGDSNDDDLFEGALCNTDATVCDGNTKITLHENLEAKDPKQDTVMKEHAAQIKSLDERLAALAGQLLVNSNDNNNVPHKPDNVKNKRPNSSKWLCEEYFMKLQLFELLDQIRECDRKKFARIKEILLTLFGEDSEDEGMMSPLEETQEFVISCKERIAPWVAKLLTPYYVKGRIRGKALFKALAKHLITLIYQCSRYPREYEVHSFVSDFLENHKMIRCEADFKQFRIENI